MSCWIPCGVHTPTIATAASGTPSSSPARGPAKAPATRPRRCSESDRGAMEEHAREAQREKERRQAGRDPPTTTEAAEHDGELADEHA